ncbi:MAG: hypothetical protein ACM3NW_05800, partial [Syntrophomonadaceae bacterium]
MMVRTGILFEAQGSRREGVDCSSNLARKPTRQCRQITLKLRLAGLFVLVCCLGTPLAAQAPSSHPVTFGTSAVSYIEIPGTAFAGTNSAVSYQQTAGYARYS